MRKRFQMRLGTSRLERGVRVALTVTSFIALGVLPAAVRAQLPPEPMGSMNDPRAGLRPGAKNGAGIEALHMRLVSWSDKPAAFDSARGTTFINSDLAFRGNTVYMGNFSGIQIWDVSNPARPAMLSHVVCPTDQGDPTIVGNLLFISSEANRARNDCGTQGVQDPKDRVRGVRIFDVSNPRSPRLIKNIQACRGSHTHTLVPHPTDRNVAYIYVGGGGGVRPEEEMPECQDTTIMAGPNRIDIIRVPLNNPQEARQIGSALIFEGLVRGPGRAQTGGGGGGGGGGRGGGRGGAAAGAPGAPAAGAAAPAQPVGGAAAAGGAVAGGAAAGGAPAGGAPAGGAAGAAAATGGRGGRGGGGGGGGGPSGCHDLTAYPAMNLVAGSCGSFGILLDVSNPERPVRLDAAADSNFSLWHTAVFSNDGRKVVFTDEWGGGTSPRCRATDPLRWGANTILTIDNGRMRQRSYFKLQAAQTDTENCVSHNGGLVPVPGRDLMVQGWYQGGVDVFDFTDPDRPFEIAYFDRGPVNDTALVIGGSWGAYWYNGYIYSSELSRGFDILELLPSEHLSQNEIDAAKLVRFEEYNPQSQPRLVWPPAFPVVRSYLDQLVRNQGLPAARTTAISTALTAAERVTGNARRDALNRLATELDGDAGRASDAARVRAMAAAVRELATASR